jgi:hypothetical protein
MDEPITAASSARARLCDLILSGVELQKVELTNSTAGRLQLVLTQMTPEKRGELYKALANENLSELAGDIKSQRLSGQTQQLLQSNPALRTILVDFAEFGDAIPGIFASANADALVARFLKHVRQLEMESKVKADDVLKAQGLAARLRRTLENSLINLIEQAIFEYGGARYGRPLRQRAKKAVGRFFFPSYRKVSDIIHFGHEFEVALLRLQMVDRLIVGTLQTPPTRSFRTIRSSCWPSKSSTGPMPSKSC